MPNIHAETKPWLIRHAFQHTLSIEVNMFQPQAMHFWDGVMLEIAKTLEPYLFFFLKSLWSLCDSNDLTVFSLKLVKINLQAMHFAVRDFDDRLVFLDSIHHNPCVFLHIISFHVFLADLQTSHCALSACASQH